MAVNRKYADLPDLDSAPDIYETPELTDDNSTVPTTIERSPSDNEFDDEDDEDIAISHSRLRIDQARSRFLPAQVDAEHVDFSDRLTSKRKSYRTSSRRHRVVRDGTTETVEFSDDEDGESLDKKIARLKREIQEAKAECDHKKEEAPQQDAELAALSKALGELSSQPAGDLLSQRRQPTSAREPSESQVEEIPSSSIHNATYTITYSPSYEQSHALAKAAEFDRRLAYLEKAIGLSSATPELESSGLPRAIMPTLEMLQNQIMTLSEASTSSLDSISRRVRTLTQEAEQLEKSRKAARAAQEELAPSSASAVETSESEQAAKINALYGTLPTVENLTPLLPPLLDRLRSLRAIHADAATASETLSRIENTQNEMASEIKQWREGLQKIEGTMGDSGTAMSENMKVVEGWVRELESKMAQLS